MRHTGTAYEKVGKAYMYTVHICIEGGGRGEVCGKGKAGKGLSAC